ADDDADAVSNIHWFTYPTYLTYPAYPTYPPILKIDVEPDPDDPRRDDLRRDAVARSDRRIERHERRRVANVENVDHWRNLTVSFEPERARYAEIDQRHGRQTLIAAVAQQYRLARSGQPGE